MSKFDEEMKKIREQIKSMIKTDTPSEQIKELTSLDKSLEGIEASHKDVVKECAEMKDLYIESIKRQGTSTQEDDVSSRKVMTLEEIAKEVIKQRK